MRVIAKEKTHTLKALNFFFRIYTSVENSVMAPQIFKRPTQLIF